MLQDDATTLVIQRCPFDELHILQGFVNHVFFDGIVNILGLETALLWPRKLGAVVEHYHGKCFEGNACRGMLKNPRILMKIRGSKATEYRYAM